MMTRKSKGVYRRLMQGGLRVRTVGAVETHGNKGPALSTVASSGGVMAGTEGGQYRPIGHREEGQTGPIRNSGKGPGVSSPAKFTGLRLVVDNSRSGRTRLQRVSPLGVRPFLVLVKG